MTQTVKCRRVPIFIPHMGCPHQCVFCNQRSISGCMAFDEERVAERIEAALATIPSDYDRQIAFFGGSFTGIDRALMRKLLGIAARFVESGRASSIRLSTRPDLIDGEVLRILSEYPVKTIELGIQSTCDRVLTASGRGHTAFDSETACRSVSESGFELVGQMMIGLPTSTPEDERQTARDIVRFGAMAARVYPTVVFSETPLAEMTANGTYAPLSLHDAVLRSADVCEILEHGGAACLRIGLCASEELSDPTRAIAGPNHPALGELVRGEMRYRELAERIREERLEGACVELEVPPHLLSQTIGQRRGNIERLLREFGTMVVSVTGVPELDRLRVRRVKSRKEGEHLLCI